MDRKPHGILLCRFLGKGAAAFGPLACRDRVWGLGDCECKNGILVGIPTKMGFGSEIPNPPQPELELEGMLQLTDQASKASSRVSSVCISIRCRQSSRSIFQHGSLNVSPKVEMLGVTSKGSIGLPGSSR